MRWYLNATIALSAAIVLVSCASQTTAVPPATGVAPANASAASASQPLSKPIVEGTWAHVCGPAAPGSFRCHALIRTDLQPDGHQHPPTINGYAPVDLQSAYKLPSATAGSGQTVAIVDAFDDPNAESDLAVYRSQFKLASCTSGSGCFRKVNQSGVAGSYPRPNKNAAQEISLDLDMVSAACPRCHILLVEANSNLASDLFAAEDEAAALGANAISNSFGGTEFAGEQSAEAHFNHPGIAITASSGDNGFGVEYPAASAFVTAVGGTTLASAPTTLRGWLETAWSGAGSGCSAFIAKPAWQHDSGCAMRTVADVSADANPNTGVAVYDTYPSGGWLVFGGTSVGAPLIAAVYALAGNSSSIVYGSFPYSHTASIFDVVGGSNGTCGTYLCNAVVGYDGPTGLGSPNGAGGF